jgi:hypothetical protein
MAAYLPRCTNCHCRAAAHAREIAPPAEFEGGSVSETVELGACQECTCPNYRIAGSDPRMCAPLKGTIQ